MTESSGNVFADMGRLMHFATALEHDVVMEIRPHPADEGAARVMVVGAA